SWLVSITLIKRANQINFRGNTPFRKWIQLALGILSYQANGPGCLCCCYHCYHYCCCYRSMIQTTVMAAIQMSHGNCFLTTAELRCLAATGGRPVWHCCLAVMNSVVRGGHCCPMGA